MNIILNIMTNTVIEVTIDHLMPVLEYNKTSIVIDSLFSSCPHWTCFGKSYTPNRLNLIGVDSGYLRFRNQVWMTL